MNDQIRSIQQAENAAEIKECFVKFSETVEEMGEAAGIARETMQRCFAEAQDVALAFLCSVVVADSELTPAENEFINQLLGRNASKEANASFLAHHMQGKWGFSRDGVPEFLQVAVKYDQATGTNFSKTFLNLLQRFGKVTSLVDNHQARTEQRVVKDYIGRLEKFLSEATT